MPGGKESAVLDIEDKKEDRTVDAPRHSLSLISDILFTDIDEVKVRETGA